MKSLGYVAQEGESEKYSLTLKLFELGARALQNVDWCAAPIFRCANFRD